ncbi:MAG: sigma-70 family RNA polymerase sigma factor [Verrucomicrobia bacterium]|nr:sigma-70 family RNA polymerase sigma factor [Verrucomicrobiota bacterium]
MALNSDDNIPTRQSLLSRLKNWDDQESWREFFDTYWRLIHRVARKAGLREDEAQDVVQETILSVAKKMPGFKYDPAVGSFRGWLFQLTRWRIINQFKKRQVLTPAPAPTRWDSEAAETAPLDSLDAPLEEIPDPAAPPLDAVWEEEWQQHLLTTAIARVKARISPSLYQMFDLHVNKRLAVTEVAQALGVSAAQIYLAKHRVGRLLKQEVKKLEAEGR